MNSIRLRLYSLLILLTVLMPACHGYVVHPGAYSVAESKVYDAISDAKNVIDISRPQLASGALPARFKPAFDKLVDSYNVAFPALKAYHEALDKGLPADAKLVQLNAAMAGLTASLTAFRGVK